MMNKKETLTRAEIIKKVEAIKNFAKAMDYKVEEMEYTNDFLHDCFSIELIGTLDNNCSYTVHSWIFDLTTLKEI